MTNGEIADRLMSLAQLLAAQKENPFKVKAYRRAAKTVRDIPESFAGLVREEADLTEFAGIGKGIGTAIREIVLSGSSQQLETLRTQVSPEVAAISEYPRLEPARVLRIYKKLGISSVEQLKEKLASGEIAAQLGARMDMHVRQALVESHEMLLYSADSVVAGFESFLLTRCGVTRVEATGDYRRRVEVVSELSFLIETGDFAGMVAKIEGARLTVSENEATFRLASGILLKLRNAGPEKWGIEMLVATGAAAHLGKLDLLKLARGKAKYPDEASVYRKLGLAYIEPELREGLDELNRVGDLVGVRDILGELHAHTTSSDGANSIEEMARAARTKDYEYTGITDHSQSLKIAGGVSEEDLRKQIRYIDKLNGKARGFQILKSAEVDILADGVLDYPDDLLAQLDYTVCSIHSKFNLGKTEQTERILRAMDNRYFTILGHATGRRLLKRPGYEIDMKRIALHARQNGCFFEINSSPERLDLSAANARLASEAGVKIAITTDAHSTAEFDFVRCGIDQARRAGLSKDAILNTRSWAELRKLFKR